MLQDNLSGRAQALSKEKVKERLNEVREEQKLSAGHYATVNGHRLFVTPNLMTRSGSKNFSSENRTADFVFGYAYCDVDSVEILLPAGYQVEAMP